MLEASLPQEKLLGDRVLVRVEAAAPAARIELAGRLEQSIEIGGLEEGVVSAQAGTLPLEIKLAEVIPVNQRLWILLDVKAGPWKVRAAKAAGS